MTTRTSAKERAAVKAAYEGLGPRIAHARRVFDESQKELRRLERLRQVLAEDLGITTGRHAPLSREDGDTSPADPSAAKPSPDGNGSAALHTDESDVDEVVAVTGEIFTTTQFRSILVARYPDRSNELTRVNVSRRLEAISKDVPPLVTLVEKGRGRRPAKYRKPKA